MDIKIEGTRAKTVSAYDVKMIRALPKLEGMKKWGANKSFSFENTPYNIEIWKSIFPECKVDLGAPQEPANLVEEAVFDVGESRPSFQYKTPPRAHQKHALEKIFSKAEFPDCFGLFMDIGTGKSWTGIAAIGRRWCEGNLTMFCSSPKMASMSNG